jgi:hypothetical protein
MATPNIAVQQSAGSRLLATRLLTAAVRRT